MRQWTLYSSGIPYGRLCFDGETVVHQQMEATTAEFSPKCELTEVDNARYKALTNIDILELAGKLPAYDRLFSQGGDEIKTETGERYQWADKGSYVQRDVKFPKNLTVADGQVVAVTCPSRERVHVLVENGYENLTVLAKWQAEYPNETIHPVARRDACDVATRDGVTLSTAVMLPADLSGGLPTILVRTPYGKEGDLPLYERYVHRGYAVVLQDTRGRNQSGGEWMPNCYEVEDGDDTLNWIAAQPWSNGKVGTIGGSYLGYVQWAAAASGNPHLCAMVSVVCAGSAFVDLPRKGGAFVSGMLAWGFAMSKKEFHPELMARDDWDAVLSIRPLEDIPRKALGYDIPFFTEWLKHMDYDELWRKSNWSERSVGAKIPTLIMSGWFDDDGMGTTEALDLTRDDPEGLRKVILGPWPHSGNSRYDIHGLPLGCNALKLDIDLTFLRWFDLHLKGIANGADQLAPVEYYTIGTNQWKTAQTWPPERTEEFTLYLSSQAHANTAGGDGTLCIAAPLAEGSDTFRYDPLDPATCIIDLSENEVGVPEDYTQQDQRQDVLCYTTPPLGEDVTLTGDFTVELYVSSDAVDTDFVVRINDVDDRGTSIKLADGLLSARYRNGFERSELMESGGIYPLRIRTSKLSNTFRKGHCIRLTVTSSAKNLIFPNSNTAAGFNGTSPVVAHNTVRHGGIYPSRVTTWRETQAFFPE